MPYRDEWEMTFEEAVAVLLYTQDSPPSNAGEKKAQTVAWGVICQKAEPLVRRFSDKN